MYCWRLIIIEALLTAKDNWGIVDVLRRWGPVVYRKCGNIEYFRKLVNVHGYKFGIVDSKHTWGIVHD
jgi:hypothetical protein